MFPRFQQVLILALNIIAFTGCSNTKEIVVVPGKSVAGIEIGMSKEQVISILGQPTREEPAGSYGELRTLGGPAWNGDLQQMSILRQTTILSYTSPPVTIGLPDGKTVGTVQLGFSERIRVVGFESLKFKYLTKDEVDKLGKPLSFHQDPQSAQVLMALAPKDRPPEQLEFHVHQFPGLFVGFVVNRTKQISSKYYFGLNYIQIVKQP